MKLRLSDLVLPISILITPLAAAIITIYGRPTVVLDAFYNRVWQDDARSGLFAALVVSVILVAALAVASIRIRFESLNGQGLLSHNYFFALLFIVGLAVLANYESWGVFGIAKVAMFFWVVFVFMQLLIFFARFTF